MVAEPGSEIFDGFVVAEGSHLLGAPILEQNGSWRAHLFVSGHPQQVMERYIAQAEENGWTVNPLSDETPFAMEGDADPPTGYDFCGSPPESGGFECHAAATDGSRCLVITALRSGRASHLQLTLMNDEASGCAMPSGVPASSNEAVPELPTHWPARPKTGEPFGEEWEVLAPVTIQDGTEVAAAPLWRSGCGGPIALLSVSGEPDEVLDRYEDEIRRISEITPESRRSQNEAEGVATERLTVAELGGGRTFSLELVTDRDGRSWLYAWACDG